MDNSSKHKCTICFRELLILAGTGAVSRFVSENEQESGDINTVSSTHIESVVKLVRTLPGTNQSNDIGVMQQ